MVFAGVELGSHVGKGHGTFDGLVVARHVVADRLVEYTVPILPARKTNNNK
jgi:NAD(P)H-hydrate repair Nnr-like enzyme with NAD(P)H-hydrate epimerase domain